MNAQALSLTVPEDSDPHSKDKERKSFGLLRETDRVVLSSPLRDRISSSRQQAFDHIAGNDCASLYRLLLAGVSDQTRDHPFEKKNHPVPEKSIRREHIYMTD
jgi:DNA-binding protein Fis